MADRMIFSVLVALWKYCTLEKHHFDVFFAYFLYNLTFIRISSIIPVIYLGGLDIYEKSE